ncbi:MAG: flagellar hook protein FlgE [Azoarcus sp.]|jgi:flagellar hook protein FlgE|nr:flagellar hook protein FlgE [Azoarcus sp.]
MAFQQGLSGLNSSSRALDVISNNVANASTVGFKAGNTIFADVYASALTGATSSIQVGIGSKVAAVYQKFTEGPLNTTNNPLDVAINGNGFFVVQRHDGTTAYTRNGQLDIDTEGYIVTPMKERVMGYKASDDGFIPVSGGTVEPLFVPRNEIAPKATTRFDIKAANLSADAEAIPASTPFDQTNVDSYNYMTSETVFDSLGGQHSLAVYFVRTNVNPSEWDVHAVLDGDASTDLTLGTPPTLSFDGYGKLAPVPGPLNYTVGPLPNGAANLDIDIDLDKVTQFGSPFSINDKSQDGYTSGQIAGIVISTDGIIQGRYSNGVTKNLGQIALATFRSDQGLISLGDNLWAETPESGQPIVGRPSTGLNGVISAGQVEESNVDLTDELVKMIIQQRNYQANAQSIRTQDQLLQTLVNLR